MVKRKIHIQQVVDIQEVLEPLSELLVAVVADGASVGFLPPLSLDKARDYWSQMMSSDNDLFIALDEDKVVGTIQLERSSKANGSHRAEVCKLMTHPKARRAGIGRMLMQAVEQRAIVYGLKLLVLDTREGDISNRLYQTEGYILAGTIPQYARSANGELHGTNYYYKLL